MLRISAVATKSMTPDFGGVTKYYADRDFMEAKLGSGPSFIWRSILEARRIISAGSCWRIGNGTKIQILGQPWLNNNNPYITTVSPALENQRVASLFCEHSKEWDFEVVHDVFEVRDQHLIASTTIEQELEDDVLTWKLENSGQYSVKSAYKLLQQEKGNWGEDILFWRSLWNIKAPTQALNLVWRALTYCLPTLLQLQSKHVPVNNIYPLCKEGTESILHALVQCRAADLCWQIFIPGINTNETVDFRTWLERNLSGKPGKTKERIIMLCWAIWRSRNDFVWNNRRWQPMKIVAKAWEYLSQWNAAQSRSFSAPITPPVPGDGAVCWVKPQHNGVKITCDAAIFEELGISGAGLIARDHDGTLISAKSKTTPEVLKPVLAEAIAVKEALSWAKEMESRPITVETDCLVVVQLIRSTAPMRSRLGQVIEDCRDLIRLNNNFKLYFVKRSANMSAHELAQVSHMYPDRTFNSQSIPASVQLCIQNDLMI